MRTFASTKMQMCLNFLRSKKEQAMISSTNSPLIFTN